MHDARRVPPITHPLNLPKLIFKQKEKRQWWGKPAVCGNSQREVFTQLLTDASGASGSAGPAETDVYLFLVSHITQRLSQSLSACLSCSRWFPVTFHSVLMLFVCIDLSRQEGLDSHRLSRTNTDQLKTSSTLKKMWFCSDAQQPAERTEARWALLSHCVPPDMKTRWFTVKHLFSEEQ